jgi:hypothetical protein
VREKTNHEEVRKEKEKYYWKTHYRERVPFNEQAVNGSIPGVEKILYSFCIRAAWVVMGQVEPFSRKQKKRNVTVFFCTANEVIGFELVSCKGGGKDTRISTNRQTIIRVYDSHERTDFVLRLDKVVVLNSARLIVF